MAQPIVHPTQCGKARPGANNHTVGEPVPPPLEIEDKANHLGALCWNGCPQENSGGMLPQREFERKIETGNTYLRHYNPRTLDNVCLAGERGHHPDGDGKYWGIWETRVQLVGE